MILTLAGCSLEKNDNKNIPDLDKDLLKVESSPTVERENSEVQRDIIDDILIKLPNLSSEQLKDYQARSLFSGSLSFCTTFNTYKPYIIEDSSWLIFEGDNLIATTREFEFSDRSQADSFAVEANKWAELFYTLPRGAWNRSNVNCWPNHTDKFYAIIHEGDRVMIIGDGDQYDYYFEAGGAIKDFHSKNNTDFYKFLSKLNDYSYLGS